MLFSTAATTPPPPPPPPKKKKRVAANIKINNKKITTYQMSQNELKQTGLYEKEIQNKVKLSKGTNPRVYFGRLSYICF
jgi:hypothetical protein